MKFTKPLYLSILADVWNSKLHFIAPGIRSSGIKYNITDICDLKLKTCGRVEYTTYLFNKNRETMANASCPFSQKCSFGGKAVLLGEPGTKSFEVGFVDSDGKKISPWHDLPLVPHEGFFTMVVEIPRNTKAKMEISSGSENNPIKQDLLSNGELRDLDCPLYWNYGAIPQTWEAPVPYVHEYPDGSASGKLARLELVGDNDPIDIIDIGRKTANVGDIIPMKPVGGLALIDQDEIDWKIFAISPHDEHFNDINDLEDIDLYYPGTTTGICEFFRWYKTPKGKPLNKFLPNKMFITRDEAIEAINKTHTHYKDLLEGKLKSDLWLPKH
ncbi:inorganic pyrophosphatase, putative [Theileria equi strain WA]|uniref:inorganic diphosphatase n=1 Tax=Theileria equi strain WA TaxID=1537102 RepID=L0AVB1_THEEQ|nr:inorganic pyrophosphatase, putative [Theileria equi strain WA]AFZ78946.1 inorganic pyrophosphatase, putative [Theileria equi strain WA]|eukprot:XP_004828612.1 inorganic pyrophosphatase, putative [Theileria equi strain WA]